MAATNATTAAPSTTTKVIFVGGWSPGPLHYLQSLLRRSTNQQQHPCTVVDVTKSIPMPPIPGAGWCCDIVVLPVMVSIVPLVWIVNHILLGHAWLRTLLSLVLILMWLRLLSVVAVRCSIRRGIQICQEEVHRDESPVVLVGFSWGGAVCIWYLLVFDK